MAMKRAVPLNHEYSSFDAIGVGGEVHLRLIGDTLNDSPEYENAKLVSEPAGKPGRKSATFYVPSFGHNVPNVSEIQYVAWTRY